MADEPILIVGAGIGGLSLAAGLARVGIEYRLFEQAPALGEVGAGLGLWTNAIRALETLGVPHASLAERAYEVRSGEAGTAAGETLARFDVAKLGEEYGVECEDGLQIGLKITHQEMANLIGSTRETISLTLAQFKKKSLLDLNGRTVVLKDQEGLGAMT